ncbi:MAG: NADH-quinone oxidoreductase subunit M [Bdellovibrionota bacterium]
MFLSLLIALPVVCALIVFALPEGKTRMTSVFLAVLQFLVSLNLLFVFDTSTPALQLVEKYLWVESFGINYFVGIDGISLWLVMMTAFFLPVVILGSWHAIESRVKMFHINLFLLQAFMFGTFLSIDSVLFYIFFEASLIPMYLMIGIWGGTRRIYATMKFFIYTMAGSLLMLVAIIAMMLMTKAQLGTMSASLLDFYKLDIPFVANEFLNSQTLMFLAFSLAFAIKVPMFPVHTWLPDAHVEAPTPGSVVLAAIMLKMGTYGFLRFVMPLFPEATQYWGWVFMLLGVIGIIYGALVAMVQPDIKKLVAYSSVSHMGYVVLGLFALNTYGVTGALYQMLNHGVSTGALFLMVGMIYERTHSREIKNYGGLASVMPIYTILFLIVTMSSIAVPGTNGFVGEFFILMGSFMKNKALGSIAVLGVVLGAAYMLWMVKKVFFGPKGELVKGATSETSNPVLKDVSLREVVVLAPLIVLIFWMGIFPNHFLKYTKTSIEFLIENKADYKLHIQGEEQAVAAIAE